MHFIKSGSGVITDSTESLHSNWQLTATAPNAIDNPEILAKKELEWIPATVPGTVAQALQTAGKWSIDKSEDFDDRDWWYQCTFESRENDQATSKSLYFDGLATLAEVWLNGECVLISNNMFVHYEVNVTRLLQASNNLSICFRSLNSALSERRPRPQWKTKLVSHQQLRWFRTTLLGRIPGWTPPVASVGPWRDIHLVSRGTISITEISIRPYVEHDDGVVSVSCFIQHNEENTEIKGKVSIGTYEASLEYKEQGKTFLLTGELRHPNPERWWPHTHGSPTLYQCSITIQIDDQTVTIDCGAIGFRMIEIDQNNGAFSISVNGQPIFCRGACWTVNDVISLTGTPHDLEKCLKLAMDAGMNMLRVGGTMVYESERFYSLCDQLGIMIWQDFMFANMDYPNTDTQFASSVSNEISQQLMRWQSHPCISVYCGNSEIEQQAAMMGMPGESWRSELFSRFIPSLCEKIHPDIPYIPSTPSGGALPFHVGRGVTHYYGVGAYMRPISEVRRANVRFTSECLGFSNVPESSTLNTLFDGQSPVCHHPLWKSRVPRDSGSAWDFEDVRDFYLKEIFQKDPVTLRCFDMTEYLALSRVTTGEVMGQVYSEWRSAHNHCRGALVWFYKDLWPGAGWGVVDSSGLPKACYYYLKRAWKAQQVVLTDEGLDGVHIHIINESEHPLNTSMDLTLLRDDQIVVARVTKECNIDGRSTLTLIADELLNGFYDVSYAYRFGPQNHDVVVATINDNAGNTINDAYLFPGQRKLIKHRNINLITSVSMEEGGNYVLSVQSDTFLQAVHFDVSGFLPNDNYFHLMPGMKKLILFERDSEVEKKFRAYIEALNLDEPLKITYKKST